VIQGTISLTLNGKPHALAGETSVAGLLETLGIDRRLVAVAHNGDVVTRARYEETILHDGDQVEVVRMVGGG